MSKKILFFISLMLLPLLALFSLPSQDLHFIACNVGQGDAILLTRGFTQILIDGGPNDQVLNCLAENMPFYDKTVELVINTHPDSDHIAGLVQVLKCYQVKQVLAQSIKPASKIAKEFYAVLEKERVPFYSPSKGEKIKLAGLEFDILWPSFVREGQALAQNTLPQRVLGAKTNENSIVMHLQYQNFDAVLTGDITSKEEAEIIKNYQFEGIEVLKVAHHGSKYSSSKEFLETVRPQIAIISVGKNSFGHPTQEVLDRLNQVGARILRTDQQKIRLKI